MSCFNEPALLGLVGERGSGKTPLVTDLIKACLKRRLTVGGVLSLSIFEGNKKIAIEMVDLESGHSRMLACLASETTANFKFGNWSFAQTTFDWANQQLLKIDYKDILIMDEIGPLELDQGRGLQVGLNLLEAGNYQVGIVTLRPKCIDSIKERFKNIKMISIENLAREHFIEKVFRIAKQ